MGRAGRMLRVALRGLGWLLAAAALLAVGIIGKAEWDARTAVPGPLPASFDVSGSPAAGNAAPVLLVGDSLGGYSAMAAAGALPAEQLRGLVIAGCSSDSGWPQVLRYLRDVVVIRVMSVFIDESAFVGKALASLGVGEQDGRAIVAAAPHATAFHFENTQHGVSMRRSVEFAALVNDFAARALAAPRRPKP